MGARATKGERGRQGVPGPLGHPDRRDHVDYKAKPEWREGMERLVRAAATVNVA